MKIALLSNVTTGVPEEFLKKEHRVWSPPGFGAWMETALAPPAEMIEFAPEAIYLLLDRHFETDRAIEEAGDPVEAAAALRSAFPDASVIVPDVAAMAADYGEGFHEEKMWRLGASPWSLDGIAELVKLFTPKKAIVRPTH